MPSKKKSEPKTESKTEPKAKVPAAPVHVNNVTARSDDDAHEGHFVTVIAGEHEGRYATFLKTDSHDPKTGYPARIILRSRDEDNLTFAEDYANVRPAPTRGGR